MYADFWVYPMWFVIGYLIGGVSITGIYCWLRHYDIAKEGESHSMTPSGVQRKFGGKAFMITAIGELSKALIVTLIAYLVTNNKWIVVCAGMGSVVGHSFSPYFGFKGGKSISQGFGALITFTFIEPILLTVLIPAFLVWGFFWWVSNRVSLGSVMGTLSANLILIVLLLTRSVSLPLGGFALLASIVILIRFWGNISRLIRGVEHKTPFPIPSIRRNTN